MNSTSMIVRGILAIILGIILTVWPAGTLEIILIFFPIFVIIDGICAIAIGAKTSKEGRWLAFIPMGILEILLGIFVFIWPQLDLTAFILIMALWAFVIGLGELVIAVSDRGITQPAKWLYAIGGILTIILGVLVLIYPIITSITLIWIFGIYFLVYGVLILITGWRVAASKK